MARNATHATLGVISFGLAVGVTWGVSVAFLALAAGLFGWGTTFAMILQGLYIGFSPSIPGAIAGAVWGFVNGLIFGVLVAWLYNRFLLTRQLHVHPLQHGRENPVPSAAGDDQAAGHPGASDRGRPAEPTRR